MHHIVADKIDDLCEFCKRLAKWEGVLVKLGGLASVYLIQSGITQEFQSLNAFLTRGYEFSQVKTITKEQFALFEHGDGLF